MKTKSIIAALLLAASSAFAQVPSYVPTNGLVGWWPFNGNANDASNNNLNGILQLGGSGSIPTLTTDRFSNPNSAFNFPGQGAHMKLPQPNSGTIVNAFSYSMWIKQDIINDFSCVIDPTYSGKILLISPQSSGIRAYDGNSFYIDGINSGLASNNWKNITVIYNNQNIYIYLNGIQIGSGTTGVNMNYYNGQTLVGYYSGSMYSYQGLLDDIGIWNRALTQQEITALYNAQSCVGNIAADGPTTFCAGNFVNLISDVVGGTYQWKRNGINIATNSTSRTFKATSSGSYTCVATCNGTALTSNSIQVTSQTNAAVTLTASGATSFCAGDSVTLNATNLGSGYSVQWYRTNISMQGATNYSVVVKQPGTYKTVTRNLANGCSRISSGSIITAVNCRMSNPDIIAVDPVSDEIPATKLGNSTETTMHLFPNPNAGSFTLEYDGIEADFEVQVVNTMGQVIYNDIIPSNDKHLKTTINLGDNMQKGVYVVRIINGENVQESKVMLQ